MTLNTWVRGPAPHDPVPLQETGGIDFPLIMRTLEELEYDGYVTVHQAFAEFMEPEDAARQSYEYLASIADFPSRIRFPRIPPSRFGPDLTE